MVEQLGALGSLFEVLRHALSGMEEQCRDNGQRRECNENEQTLFHPCWAMWAMPITCISSMGFTPRRYNVLSEAGWRDNSAKTKYHVSLIWHWPILLTHFLCILHTFEPQNISRMYGKRRDLRASPTINPWSILLRCVNEGVLLRITLHHSIEFAWYQDSQSGLTFQCFQTYPVSRSTVAS